MNSAQQQVKLNQWVSVGSRKGIVSNLYEANPNMIEIVYLDDRDRAINEDAQFDNGKWSFLNKGPDGGYADNNPRLSSFVRKLKAGRWWEE